MCGAPETAYAASPYDTESYMDTSMVTVFCVAKNVLSMFLRMQDTFYQSGIGKTSRKAARMHGLLQLSL